MRIVCLGEALVDLIEDPGEGGAFRPYFGGALANAAVAAARAGAEVELAGGSGPDRFGRFLRDRLGAEGVGLEHHHLIDGLRTPFALVHLVLGGEPEFSIFGDGIEASLAPLVGRERELVADADALLLGSNTLVSEPGLGVSMRAVEAARVAGVPILFDPNLRPGRWPSLELAVERCRPIIAASAVTKANRWEAASLAGAGGLEAPGAAQAVADLGAEIGVVTDGPRGAAARGRAEAEADGEEVVDPWPLGAGDAFMGTLAAVLVRAGLEPSALEGALGSAAAAGAAACRRVGAID